MEPTPAHRTAEVESTMTMSERVEEQFDIKPDRLIGDTAYGTAPMLAWMVDEKDIEPHVPVWDKTERTNDNLSISDFQWNEEAQECTRLDHDPSDRALLSQASSITFSLGISGVHALAAEANRP